MDRIDAWRGLAETAGAPSGEVMVICGGANVGRSVLAEEYSPKKILIIGGPDSGLSFVRETAMLGNQEVVLYKGDYWPVQRHLDGLFIEVEEV